MPEIFQPDKGDWVKIQGGEPDVSLVPPNLVRIIHDYPGGSGLVVEMSQARMDSMGSQRFLIEGNIVEFPVAKLRKFTQHMSVRKSKL